MDVLSTTHYQVQQNSARMLCFPTLEEWRRVFPTRDICQAPAYTLMTCVECGARLVGLTRDLPKIERLNLHPICRMCAHLQVAA